MHIQALKEIITDFPYLQHAHGILTKALFNQKHYEFEKQLKHTALIVPDREVLYAYIYDLQNHSAEVSVLPEVSMPVAVEAEIEVKIEKEEKIIEEIKIEEPVSVVEVSEVIEEKEEPQSEPIPQPTELSFFEWLNYANKNEIKIEAPEFSSVIEEKEDEPVSVPQPKSEPQSNVSQFDNILDKFIRENPSISRPKSTFYSPVNMAKQSVAENEEFVTETLANIYYKQGHHKKAIRTYEKLCLIYPHKMAYFAALIQKIKTENKD